jgi:glutaminyl-peptide cyclotransferase
VKALLALLLPFALGGAAAPSSALPAIQGYTVVRVYPHDPGAFTEGLFYRDGQLFESTGLVGRSDIREVRLADGKVLRRVAIPPQLFGEGIVDWKGQIISLTWQTGIGFRWDRSSFRRLGAFHYPGEGWALTRSGKEIVMSDGTPVLRFLDPETFAVRRRLTVTEAGAPLTDLNELEWVDGAILANVWHSDSIVRIDPATGRVTARIDLSALARLPNRGEDDVLNGIAWDAAGRRLFVTGKNWPRLYEIRLTATPKRRGG